MCKACGRGVDRKILKEEGSQAEIYNSVVFINDTFGYPTIAFDYDKSPKCKNLTGQEDATDLLPEYLFISS